MSITCIAGKKFLGIIRIQYLGLLLVFSMGNIYAQESNHPSRTSTNISLSYAASLSFGEDLNNQSIGGDWGIHLTHVFPNELLGFSVGLNYALVNSGSGNSFTNPSEANEFKFIETPLEVIIIPSSKFPNSFIKIGGSHSLLLDTNFRGHISDYNVWSYGAAFEQNFNTKSALVLASGIRFKSTKIPANSIGRLIVFSLYFKVGMKA